MGALMLSLSIDHPDSPQFIASKEDLSKITGANISVKLTDSFMKAVINEEDYILKWPCYYNSRFIFEDTIANLPYNELAELTNDLGSVKVYVKKVKAKELWDSIIHHAWLSAEPGVLFWDTIINNDPAGTYDEFKAISTNPCVIPSTTLLTKTGFQPIINLVGQEIEIWNGNTWTLVKPFKTSEKEKVFKVSFSDGTDLTCTAYHEFILSDNKRKELRNIKIGDKLTKFSYPIIGNKKSNYELNNSLFYTQGFFSGDGTIAEEEGRSTRYFIDLYGEKIKLLTYLNVEKYGTHDSENDKIRTIIKESLISPYKDFVPESPNYEIEDRLMWLAGLLDSDGTLNDEGGSLAIASIDKNFLFKVKSLLITLGIRSTIGINKEAKTKIIKEKTYNCKTCYRLVISSFSVKQLMELGLETFRIPLIANPNRDAGRFLQITAIEEAGESDTYCVTDDKNHSALFNHIMTGQCGEIPLPSKDSCRLIATNLFSIVNKPFTSEANINAEQLYKIFYMAQIIGDILVDLEIDAVQKIIDNTSGSEQQLWKEIQQMGIKGRRTGVGLLGLADLFAAMNKNYNDFTFAEFIMKMKLQAELDATTDLAILNGHFPAYNPSNEYKNNLGQNNWYRFIQEEFPVQYERMNRWGRRNISFSTIAPTGSISILAGVSSGCEPVFSLYYTRRKKCNPGEEHDFVDTDGLKFKNYNVIHPTFIKWFLTKYPESSYDILVNMKSEELDELIKTSPWYRNTSAEINSEDRVKLQSILQKYTTHSISSTINLPEETTENVISDIYEQAYLLGCKGVTVYRDNSRSGILVKQQLPVLQDRPLELTCRVVRFKNERKNWIAFVGIINGKPYEIFSGVNDIDELPIPSYIESGTIFKIKTETGSRYDFSYIDKYGYSNTVGGLNRIFDKEFWNYARFVSALLREGIQVENIIKIIEKLEFTNKGMNNWKSGIIRSLKVFVPDGTKAVGSICDNCNSTNIVYEGGCMICKDCGSSHCN